MSAKPEKQKRCCKCKKTKQVSEFHRDRSKKDGLQNWCMSCRRKWRAKYRADNKDRIAARTAKYRAANKDKIAEYYEANKERIAAKHAEWARNNSDKTRAKTHRYRGRRRKAEGTFTADQWKARLAYHGYKCIYCGVEKQDTPQKYLTMEHLIPLCRGGTNWASNLAPSCKSCNCSKNSKTHFEYLEYLNAKKEI